MAETALHSLKSGIERRFFSVFFYKYVKKKCGSFEKERYTLFTGKRESRSTPLHGEYMSSTLTRYTKAKKDRKTKNKTPEKKNDEI